MSQVGKDRFNKALVYLRMFLQDTPELNMLTRKRELGDEQLRFCIDMAISDYNTTIPPTPSVTIQTYPSLFLLMHGAAIQALKMAGIRQSRNELNYQSGGSSFNRSNKTQHYQSWLSLFMNEYEQKKRSFKVSRNIQRGYGEVYSEYDYLGFW